MKKLLFAALLFVSLSSCSQNVKQDANGNFIALSKAKTEDKNTGKTFTDAHGNTWPVYVSAKGRYYALRTSKNGNTYKQYLTVESK